jgi:putative ABC transport system permease protein
MNAWWSDTRLAARRLLNSPGFSLATVLMLGLGIALSVTMFSVVRNVLLAGLPFPDSERVMAVGAQSAANAVTNGQLTGAEAARLAQADGPFEAFGYYNWGGLTVYDGERPREFTIVIVGDGFFPALGLAPLMGRWFAPEDFEQGADAIVISHAEWQRLLGGAADAIGRTIETSDGRMRVIGVMPENFATPSDEVGGWRPMAAARMQSAEPWFWNARFMFGVARLKADATAQQTRERLDAAMAQVRSQYGMPSEDWRFSATPALDEIVGDVRGVLWGAFAIALLVLLIGCANVAIAIDARQLARRHEQALTQALGATRVRLYRGLMIEIALLAVTAVGVGIGLSILGIDWLRELARNSLPRVDAIAMQGDVLAFAIALALLLPFVAVGAGSLRLRSDAAQAIRGGGKGLVAGSNRKRRVLPALGVALSTISLVAASALLFSLFALQKVDPGFRTDNVHAMQLFVDGGPQVWRQSGAALLDKLAAIPGVEKAAITSAAPLSQIGSFSIDLQLPGRERPEPFQIGLRRVSPDYLDLLGIPLVAGRNITANDSEGSEPVAVVNRELARRVFGDEVAIDKTILLPLGQGARVSYRVVGVMDDVRNAGLRAQPAPELLVSQAQAPWMGMTFLVRTAQPLPGIDKQMAEALWQVAPLEAITRQFTLADEIDAQLATARFFTRTVGSFALAALLLAALGVYAVAALQQQQRVAEFGLRLAIGARPASLVTQILRGSFGSISVGIAAGLCAAWAVLTVIEAQLVDAGTQRTLALGSGALLIGAAALIAALLPALRAARTDPMTSLRHS